MQNGLMGVPVFEEYVEEETDFKLGYCFVTMGIHYW